MILIVDDDYDVASLIRISIEKLGLTAISFTEPLEALKDFGINFLDYNLVISDIRMPIMNGYEFAEEVKKIKPSVKIFLMSAFEYSDSYFTKAFTHSEIEGFIEKPISLNELNKIVLGYTNHHQHNDVPYCN
ncbi:MAG TPA: response regulator [Nitrososphaeraceae archaeon]|jgi:DNA-binding NtrC family response regulator